MPPRAHSSALYTTDEYLTDCKNPQCLELKMHTCSSAFLLMAKPGNNVVNNGYNDFFLNITDVWALGTLAAPTDSLLIYISSSEYLWQEK